MSERVFVPEEGEQDEWLIMEADDTVQRVRGNVTVEGGALRVEVLGHFDVPVRSDPFWRLIRAWGVGAWKYVERAK